MAGPEQQTGDHEPFATMGQVKGIVRRRNRKRPEHTEESLNIYPMMDMMTILLVFLIMQFSATAADVIQSRELQLPYSTSVQEMAEAISIQISTNKITVDGEEVCQLRPGGLVDPSIKQGGGTGFLITPLLTRMQQHAQRLKLIAQQRPSSPFRGEVQIIADKRTPFRTLAEVIYTLGQAEFKSMRFVVLQHGG
jgi:biopolymer transport protein ExbD